MGRVKIDGAIGLLDYWTIGLLIPSTGLFTLAGTYKTKTRGYYNVRYSSLYGG